MEIMLYVVESTDGETLNSFVEDLDAARAFLADLDSEFLPAKLFAVTCVETERELITER